MNDNINEDYELTSHQELEDIKKELELLKRNSVKSPQSNDLITSIHELTASVNALINLFKYASQNITQGEHKEQELTQRFDPMMHKINTLIEQNKKLAAGIVSVAELIKNKLESELIQQKPSYTPQPMQINSSPTQFQPSIQPINNDISNLSNDLPPPPSFNDMPDFGMDKDFSQMNNPFPEPPKKKGLFTR